MTEFFPGFGMDSLSEMMSMYKQLSGAPDFPRFRAAKAQWFPLFRSGGTDFYSILCGTKDAADSQIVNDDNEGPHRDGTTLPVIEFVSLEGMLKL